MSDNYEKIAVDAITIIHALGHEDLALMLQRRVATIRVIYDA